IDRVEDVLALGDELEVRVDDIDQNGKLSLSLVGDEPEDGGDGTDRDRGERGSRSDRGDRDRGDRDDRGARADRTPRESASFEAFWDTQAREEFGALGPADEPPP